MLDLDLFYMMFVTNPCSFFLWQYVGLEMSWLKEYKKSDYVFKSFRLQIYVWGSSFKYLLCCPKTCHLGIVTELNSSR